MGKRPSHVVSDNRRGSFLAGTYIYIYVLLGLQSTQDIDARLRVIIRDRVYPVLSAGYGVPADDMSLRDLFVVKYSGGAQRGLVRHRDGCELSFGIALTAKHDESAGTYFASFRYLLRNVQIGELWTHPSLVLHAARSVSQEDLRYVLIGFVQVRPTWKRFWRTWGAWATQLKEWQIDVSLEHEMQHLLFASASISTPTLAKRRLRKIFRELSAAEAPLAGKALVLIAVFLCLTLCVLSCMCVYDIMRHLCLASHCMPDECDQNDNTEALARGRYADDAKARTQLRCSPSTRGAVPARTREDAAAERSTESAARRRGKTLSVWQSKDNACDIFGLENGRRFTTTR